MVVNLSCYQGNYDHLWSYWHCHLSLLLSYFTDNRLVLKNLVRDEEKIIQLLVDKHKLMSGKQARALMDASLNPLEVSAGIRTNRGPVAQGPKILSCAPKFWEKMPITQCKSFIWDSLGP